LPKKDKVKKKISITIDPELLKWIDDQTKKVEYTSRSHVFEIATSMFRLYLGGRSNNKTGI